MDREKELEQLLGCDDVRMALNHLHFHYNTHSKFSERDRIGVLRERITEILKKEVAETVV